ncbi:2-polyprenyl-6-methoxyphenol hydroxylase-like FAD-dependent oxidoreductase [Microvirga subterranea]|uniref:2-polyprenyl-6-methoxyphenol hydroxylase-like FAD-dependent oxidoreductase n=2 Tax=Microvirga subterranea TaxID=186651 RepID=A0A370HI26_9HYPH|nr:FAD binding domain-containing protein [Microvirga subterranea]RDI56801.1 2-polyprenyl-6-methoxyphenol hydroxylase-like FAD-dependent oxidoreductase [Microvirga subterranea]
MPVQKRRAIIIGGSMGGLFAALLLERIGWDTHVFERVTAELSGRGAGIVTHPELVETLALVGIHPGDDLGVPIEERRTLGIDGDVIGRYRCPQIATSWNHLFQMLRNAYPAERYHQGKELVRIEEHSGGVTAHFADGSSMEGDLLLGADGIRSAVRQQFLPDVRPVYAGYVAWRGLVEESALPQAALQDLFPYFAFCLPPGEQMLGYPVAGAGNDLRQGHRRYNFVWYRPADESDELRRLLTDERGHTHSGSIPPPLIAARSIGEMRSHGERVLAPPFRELLRVTEQPFLQPIYDLESPRMAFQRVALIGDAAFVARPHVGGGVAKAAHDGMALAQALSTEVDVESALNRFEAERLAIGRRIVDQARRLGSYMRTRFESLEERQLAERHQTPEAVMNETALLTFLHGADFGQAERVQATM